MPKYKVKVSVFGSRVIEAISQSDAEDKAEDLGISNLDLSGHYEVQDVSPVEIEHPDIEWAKETVRKNKGDRVTETELDTITWAPVMSCYMMEWRGMVLGIEKDGHIHS